MNRRSREAQQDVRPITCAAGKWGHSTFLIAPPAHGGCCPGGKQWGLESFLIEPRFEARDDLLAWCILRRWAPRVEAGNCYCQRRRDGEGEESTNDELGPGRGPGSTERHDEHQHGNV